VKEILTPILDERFQGGTRFGEPPSEVGDNDGLS
jgi:hypothetical protein